VWEEALPVGNGRLGAMVFGRVGQERLQLNEDTLWAGSPNTPDSPDALAALPEVRALIAQGQYKQAEELVSEKMMARPMWQAPYGTLGDLLIDLADAAAPSAYRRELDLQSAIAATEYRTGSVWIRQEAFVSRPDQAIIWAVEAGKGGLDFELTYRAPREMQYGNPDYSRVAAEIEGQRTVDWLQKEDAGVRPDGVQVRPDGPKAWLITGHNEAAPGVPGGLHYALRIEVVTDGQVTISDRAMAVAGASRAMLVICAATSYVNYLDTSGDPVATVREQGARAAAKPLAALRSAHVADHRAQFDTFAVDLGGADRSDTPTDVRIYEAGKADDPSLAALYLQYARYLLLASSRAGTQPATLQGIWNAGTNPPWGCKYTININTEMNYWIAGPAGLSSCVEPLLRMVEELAVTGARTARTMYGARGWVAHHNTDLWRAAAPVDGAFWGMWPCGGAWLCNTLWQQYEYTLDPAMLARLYPVMRGAALFFLDTLIEDPDGRGLITSPSISPENGHPFGSSICAGPTMDRQIVRDLFHQVATAAQQLGVDAGLATEVSQAADRIAPDRIGKEGQLLEWLDDWDGAAPEQQHRHISHLYGLFPSEQINLRDTPDLAKACAVTLRTRGDLSTGWATAWRICCWARLGDGDHAHSILASLLGPQRTYPNMFDAHPPFQIDGNFGGGMGIIEMILQSWGDGITLLPALPSAWPTGRMSGVRARGNIAADIAWQDGALSALHLRGPASSEVAIHYRNHSIQAKFDRHGRYSIPVNASRFFG
jgi:alpha-L-fucosidase 2